MSRTILREKDTCILNIAVEQYLRIGKPVCSGVIARQTSFNISSATVRNIMVKLESQGYFHQLHTSSGRIPTDKGLRFYVNALQQEAEGVPENINLPPQDIFPGGCDLSSLLIQASRTLSEYSDNLGFVISPKISRIDLSTIRFIKIAENRIFIMLVTFKHLVLTGAVETSEYFTQNDLDAAARFINRNFHGKNLIYIRNYILEQMPRYRIQFADAIHKVALMLRGYIIQEEKENQIFVEGTSKLLGKPDLVQEGGLKTLFEKLEEKEKLAKLLSDFISLKQVKVLIGSELDLPDVLGCSLILSHYGYNRQVLGSLGILGPKRIPYRKIIPVVDCVAKKLSQSLSLYQS